MKSERHLTHQLHVIPVVNDAMLHGVGERQNTSHAVRLVSNIVVTVLIVSHRFLCEIQTVT